MSTQAAGSVADLVLCAVECVPPGRVVSYGDIAELVGTSARRVGTIMAQVGSEVSWWRVTNASGRLPASLIPEAARHWIVEGTPTRGDAVVMAVARADLVKLARDYALAILPD